MPMSSMITRSRWMITILLKIKKIEEEKIAMRLKIKRIRKYAINKEAWYHYVVGSMVTLVAILIAFIVAFKCIN